MVSESDVAAALSVIDPAFELQEATPVDRGAASIFRVRVGTPDGPREWVFKTDPDDEWDIGVDPRLLAILDAHTDIPAPSVLGAIDAHPEVPAPSYLMTAVGGEDLAYVDVGWLEDDALERLAREMGRSLGALHGLDAVDSYGLVSTAGPALSGEAPDGGFDTVAVEVGYDDAASFVDAWIEQELGRHAEGRFADLTPDLRSWFDEHLPAAGPSGPVLTRNDHGLHNLRVDPDTGEIVGVIDWAYTLAAPPAFDLGYATYIYSGAYLAGLPDVEDRSELVRTALHAGYRETAPDGPAGATRASGPYELLAAVRLMNDFGSLVPQLPEVADVDAVAARIRSDVESALE